MSKCRKIAKFLSSKDDIGLPIECKLILAKAHKRQKYKVDFSKTNLVPAIK